MAYGRTSAYADVKLPSAAADARPEGALRRDFQSPTMRMLPFIKMHLGYKRYSRKVHRAQVPCTAAEKLRRI